MIVGDGRFNLVALERDFAMTATSRLLARLACFLLPATMICAPASAENVPYNFAYYAYELETDGGARAVYKRIEKKARATCVSPSDRGIARRHALACVEDVTAHIVSAIDHQHLSALHYRRTELAQG